jgi:copper chaperone CopZ
MRAYVYGLIIFLGAVFVGFTYDDFRPHRTALPETTPRPDSIRIVRIHVEGLTPSKVDLASSALASVAGVLSVDLKPDQKEAIVRFDITHADLGSIQESLRSAGFTPYFH